MDTRREADRASLEEQMKRLQRNINKRADKRQEGRERRRGSDSDEDDTRAREPKRPRNAGAREIGQLNIGSGALAEGGLSIPRFEWRCELCKITVRSQALKQQHLEGAAHLKAVAKAKADEKGKPKENAMAQMAIAMGQRAAALQPETAAAPARVQEKKVAYDHYGNEIQAVGLTPHVAETGLVYKGQGYQVIQRKMKNTITRSAGGEAAPLPAAPQPKQVKAKAAVAPKAAPRPAVGWEAPLPSNYDTNTGSVWKHGRQRPGGLGGWSAPLPASLTSAAAWAPPALNAASAGSAAKAAPEKAAPPGSSDEESDEQETAPAAEREEDEAEGQTEGREEAGPGGEGMEAEQNGGEAEDSTPADDDDGDDDDGDGLGGLLGAYGSDGDDDDDGGDDGETAQPKAVDNWDSDDDSSSEEEGAVGRLLDTL